MGGESNGQFKKDGKAPRLYLDRNAGRYGYNRDPGRNNVNGYSGISP